MMETLAIVKNLALRVVYSRGEMRRGDAVIVTTRFLEAGRSTTDVGWVSELLSLMDEINKTSGIKFPIEYIKSHCSGQQP